MRRYTDLVNQWQIVACARHGATAALAAPFKPKDAALFAIISAFDGAYTAYNAHQSSMERYWALRALQQQNVQELSATVFKTFPNQAPLARADNWPLVVALQGANDIARGTQVWVRITSVDLMGLDLHVQLVRVLHGPDGSPQTDMSDSDEDGDDAVGSGALQIAVDVNEAPEDAGAP